LRKLASCANAQEKHLSFRTTAASIPVTHRVTDIFSAKLKEMSGGKIWSISFPVRNSARSRKSCNLVKSGDIDFGASFHRPHRDNLAAGRVMSLHFLFRGRDHRSSARRAESVRSDPRHDRSDGAGHPRHRAGTRACRNMYSKKKFTNRGHQGPKIRVQATATEDATFAAYGAQTRAHCPFGSDLHLAAGPASV